MLGTSRGTRWSAAAKGHDKREGFGLVADHVDARRLEVVADGRHRHCSHPETGRHSMFDALMWYCSVQGPSAGKSEHPLRRRWNTEEPDWWSLPARSRASGLPRRSHSLDILTKDKTRHVSALCTTAKLAWTWRWTTILTCASARSCGTVFWISEVFRTPTTDGRLDMRVSRDDSETVPH